MSPLSFSFLTPPAAIASTYTYLYDWAEQHPEATSGMVVDIAYQQQGRGQQGNSWFSSEGLNLIPSILLKYDTLSVTQGWNISMLTSLAVIDAVRSFVRDAHKLYIKWPNDIYYGDHKLAGILIGHSLQGNRIDFSIVGIGLNVNEVLFPPSLPNPISLALIGGTMLSLEKVRSALYESLAKWLSCADDISEEERIHRAYCALLYRRGEWYYYQDAATGQLFEGCIKGVLRNGLLEMAIKGEEEHRFFSFKELVYLLSLQ